MTTKRARTRLTGIHTQEVGLVDRAANGRKFLVTKGLSMDLLKLPSAAKGALSDALAAAVEKLTALGQAVATAEVDDAAQVPPELGAALSETASALASQAEALGGGAPPADEHIELVDDQGVTMDAAAVEAAVGKAEMHPLVALEATMRAASCLMGRAQGLLDGWGGKDPDPARAAQILRDALGVLENGGLAAPMAAPPPTSDPAAVEASAEAEKSSIVARMVANETTKATPATIAKGRKISASRFKQVLEAHKKLTELIASLGDPAEYEAKAKKPKEEGPPAEMAKSAPVEADLRSLMANLTKAIDGIGERLGVVEKRVSTRSVSNGPPPSNGVGETVRKSSEPAWPSDLSAHVAEKGPLV